MGELVSSMVVLGLVTGLSPFTIACLFVVVDAPRPGRNGVLFLLGDAIALITVMLVVALVFGGKVDTSSTPRTGVLWVQLILGLALVVVAARLERKPKPPPDQPMPAALQKLQNLKPWAALVAGGATTMYPAAAVAASDLVTNDFSTAQRLGATLVFLGLALGLPAIPVILLAVSQGARDRLASWREWLLGNRTKVGGVLGLLVGLSIAVKAGVSLLAS
jgi:hypothetical protein